MKFKAIALDVETTGLDTSEDEILQISAVDENGNTVINLYTKPTRHIAWPEATLVNGIEPEGVQECPTFSQIRPIVQSLIDNTETLVTYNGTRFDIPMLISHGIDVSKIKYHHADVMEIAISVIGTGYNFEKNRQIWPKLSELAEKMLDSEIETFFMPFESFHDSRTDARITMKLYQMFKNGGI